MSDPKHGVGGQNVPWGALVVLATAFGVLEAAVVVELRTFLDPHGRLFPAIALPDTLYRVELLRELSTLVLLLGASVLAVQGRTARFAVFLFLFGVWDVVYYVALRMLLSWPTGWGTWDLLFLLPVPWLGPVYAPFVVATTMIGAGAIALVYERRHGPFEVRFRHGVGALTGGLLVVGSFVVPSLVAPQTTVPDRFPVEWWCLGELVGIVAFLDAWRCNHARLARRVTRAVPS